MTISSRNKLVITKKRYINKGDLTGMCWSLSMPCKWEVQILPTGIWLFKSSIEGDIRHHYSFRLFHQFPSFIRATYGSAECTWQFLCFIRQDKSHRME